MSRLSERQRYYTFADEVLVRRVMQGNTEAQTVLDNRRAVQQMCTETAKESSSSDYRCHLSDEVRLHFRKDQDRLGYVWMFLEIGEHMSLDAIKRQWKAIRTWRDLLLEWQGPSPFGINGVFYQFHLDQKRGQSYTVIAERLNERMVSGLEALLEQDHALSQAIESGTILTVQDLTQWQQTTDGDTSDLFIIQGALQEWGFADNEINQWCLSVLETLVAGRKALPRGGPFKREWVISKLRTWRAKNRQWLTTVNNALGRTPNT